MLIALVALSVFSVLMAIIIVMGLRKVHKLEKQVEFMDCTRFNELYDHSDKKFNQLSEFIEREILSHSYTNSLHYRLYENIDSCAKNIRDEIVTSKLNNDKDVDRRLEKIYKKIYELDKSFDKLEIKNKEYCDYLAEKIREISKYIEIVSPK